MKPLGRIITLILVIGLCVGGYRWWQQGHGGASGGSFFSLPKLSFGGLGGGNTSGSNPSGDIEVLTTATKKGWLQEEIDAFNGQNTGKYHLTLKLIESREAMHDILGGKEQPVVWSPSSPVWIARLGEVWAQKNPGQPIVDLGDPSGYRTYFKSPLVFITTRDKASFLRPLLSGPRPWASVRALSSGSKRAPWGELRWAHADPLNASSGMLTMALILTEYAQENGKSGDLEAAASSTGFASYLQAVERRFTYDPATLGSTALESAYLQNPQRMDFITAYESKGLEAVAQNPDLVVIYPNPTANADQSAAVLSAPWVSDTQRQGGQAFLKFLSGQQALQDGMTYHFRPTLGGSGLSLTGELSDRAGRGFQETYTAIELPPYGALNEAANQWRVYIARK